MTDELIEKKTRKKHYVNNADMHKALIEWQLLLVVDPMTRIPDYIGDCFTRIATQRARHPWFSGYTFKDEMIAEAVLTCVKYCRNYDAVKSDNPFSYFTQFVNNSFFQVMQKEKKIADYKFEQVKEIQQNSEGFDYNNFFNDEG